MIVLPVRYRIDAGIIAESGDSAPQNRRNAIDGFPKGITSLVFFFSLGLLLLSVPASADTLLPLADATVSPSVPQDAAASPIDPLKGMLLPGYDRNWSVYGYLTAIYQGYPGFHANYSGAQSLPSSGQIKNIEVADIFIGRRLWQSAAIYIDPQLYRGYGLNGSIGMAGFPDGEANKGGTSYGNPELGRLYLQQIFGFGGLTETLPRGPNQVQETADVSRLTVTGGKFSYTDFFDGNRYSHDPETQFMNWSFMDSLAWDWAQDSKGYSWGAVFELNQERWALRYGVMVPVNEINGDRFRLHGGNELDHALELEERYEVMSRPGKARMLLFYNREIAGNFEEALAQGGAINDAIADTREYGRVEYGFAINLEQQLKDDLGAFLRASWNNGAVENYGFTQADYSIAGGISLQGKQWNREDDVAGAAIAVNGVSTQQRKALEAGYTTGLILGDGGLSYSGESVLEAYYNYQLTSYARLGPDYQFVLHPAYNTDRGPVNIFALRANMRF